MVNSIVDKNIEYYRLIKESLSEHKLAFFVGSGVSRASASGDTYPLWSDILKKLQRGLIGCKDSDPLKIAQLYALKYGPVKLKSTVGSCFPTKDIPSDIQRAILKLRPHCIITTNWDCLFENCIEEEINYIYDVIASDNELTKSKNDNKIIKMHGDFHHDNYIFTEDDYLNYSNRFPLIENYIKSIISTHTIVMIGYSFSDIDLKQIVNWFQNHSTVQPPIYMVVNKYDEFLERYLEKFRIITIVVENENRTESLKSFLTELGTPTDFSQNPVEYVYNEIKKYDNYYVALQKNICNSLKNSEILYDSQKRGILHFHEYNFREKEDEKRKDIYQNFIKELSGCDEKINRICNILAKANITGFVTSIDEKNCYKYRLFTENNVREESAIINFDYSIKKDEDDISSVLRNIVCFRNLGRIEEAFECNRRMISLCKRKHNYLYLLVGFFNHNLLLNELKYISDLEIKFKQESRFSIDIEYSFFPKDAQRDCEEMKNFLTMLDLYKFQFESFTNVKEKEKNYRIIDRGGMVFSSNENKPESELQNLIDFVLLNGICIEDFSIYRELCKNYVSIALLQQQKKKKNTLSKIDLYVCIKYYKSDDLKYLFEDFQKKGKRKNLALNQDLLNWLVDSVIKNCVDHFIDRTSYSIWDNFDGYIEKALFILSLNELSDELYKKIWAILNRLVNEAKNTLVIFSAINSFFAIQWNLYSRSFNQKQIIILLENLLNKFICKKMNGYEETALSWNRLYNLYYCGRILKSKFTSDYIIHNIIRNIDDYSEKEKIEFIQNVLLELYQISDKNCQKIIKQYVVNQKISKMENNDFGQFINTTNYHLYLIAFNLKKNKNEVCKLVEKLIDGYPPKTYYSSIRSTLNILEFLKKDNTFLGVYKRLKNTVDDLERRFHGA